MILNGSSEWNDRIVMRQHIIHVTGCPQNVAGLGGGNQKNMLYVYTFAKREIDPIWRACFSFLGGKKNTN